MEDGPTRRAAGVFPLARQACGAQLGCPNLAGSAIKSIARSKRHNVSAPSELRPHPRRECVQPEFLAGLTDTIIEAEELQSAIAVLATSADARWIASAFEWVRQETVAGRAPRLGATRRICIEMPPPSGARVDPPPRLVSSPSAAARV